MTNSVWVPAVARHLEPSRAEILAFAAFPKDVWMRICPNNPAERLNEEIHRRTDSVGMPPNHDAIIRLVEALLTDQTGE